ncbi:GSCOCG00007625001-RA-CDS [Cotesia congregata]|nr:GSCOCG00007625001-RA-CDS [Cotesia congregata]
MMLLFLRFSGSTKKNLESETKTTIKIPSIGSTENNIVIIGKNRSSVISCRQRIDLIVESSRKKLSFTHFVSIPLDYEVIINNFKKFKNEILNDSELKFSGLSEEFFVSPNKLHLTIGMLLLVDDKEKKNAIETLDACVKNIIKPILKEKGPINIKIQGLEIMNDDTEKVKVLYGKVFKNDTLQEIANKTQNFFVEKELMSIQYTEIVNLHMTLINTSRVIDKSKKYSKAPNFDATKILKKYKDYYFGDSKLEKINISIRNVNNEDNSYEKLTEINLSTIPKRVIIFCLLTTILPISLIIVPLYLRHNLYANVAYLVNESDVLEISDGISTIFCSAHTLEMNGTFNAFQMSHRPEITTSRKHLRLKKSMNLPDDTLEYWGFYLLRGASVGLSVCSRFPGASILVVKGEKILRTCGMLDHNKNKARTTGIFLPEAHDQVKITFESDAREIESEELATSTLSSTSLPKLPPNITNKYIQNILKARMESNPTRKLRHTRKRLKKQPKEQNNKTKKKVNNKQNHQKTSKLLKDLNYFDSNTASEEDDRGIKIITSHYHHRVKRNQEPVKPPELLDQGIQHGGNALRNLTDDEDSSVSSFEEGLLNCYGGQVLLQQEFEPSDLCIN